MTEEEKAQRAEQQRWADEGRAALSPKRKTKGAHDYPSPSTVGTLYRSVPPLGHKGTFRKLREAGD